MPTYQVLLRSLFKVTGYSLGRVPHSKRDNSQCSLAPDYGYKRWSTDRETPRAYTQPEGIGYHVGTVSHGRSNSRGTNFLINPCESFKCILIFFMALISAEANCEMQVYY